MFDYVSTITSYSLVGMAIFTGKYNHMSPVQLASAVSRVSAINITQPSQYLISLLMYSGKHTTYGDFEECLVIIKVVCVCVLL